MISRITSLAVVFAVFGTASLAFAAQVQSQFEREKAARDAGTTQIVQLPQVEVIGHRSR